MKIGIITFHFVSNKGGVLQCFALQKYLNKLGHEVYIIDYRPKYHTVRYTTWKNPAIYTRWYWGKFRNKNLPTRLFYTAKSFARVMIMNILQKDKKTAKLFSDFISKTLKLTTPYRSVQELQSEPPAMDAYISGSDQLWNPDILNQEFDSAYFLNFGKPSTKRITYAVSIGKTPTKSELNQISQFCKKLDFISLREQDQCVIDAIDKNVSISLDPTLLLEAADYKPIESTDSYKQPYIFVYGFETNLDMQNAVDAAVKKHHCRVINGSPDRIRLIQNTEKLESYGPEHFLTLIKNADCVVTNSFHGTTFSIIYKKDFITIPHTTRGIRMVSLLEKLNLQKRLWGNEAFSLESHIDYDDVFQKLSLLQTESKQYLENALIEVK